MENTSHRKYTLVTTFIRKKLKTVVQKLSLAAPAKLVITDFKQN